MNQIAKIIYQYWMNSMKSTLDFEESKYDQGRNDPKYKYFKKVVMANNYENMNKLFQKLNESGLIQKTTYEEDVKGGYKDNDSGGSGYINTNKMNDFFK